MFSYDLSDILRKKLSKLGRKDKVLAEIFYKKVQEVINRDEHSINAYKNLKSPMNEYKRIHLTDNYILMFAVEKKHIVFIDIEHWDKAYG
jgi:mRNA-degrading endonuclease RelE of RelBE toxin-antitoxin system